jgi:hypothetical protein
MNKPVAFDDLIPVREFAPTVINRRGFPCSVQYIYNRVNNNITINYLYPMFSSVSEDNLFICIIVAIIYLV